MAKRGNGEGSVFRDKNGSYRGFITIGYDSNGRQIKKWRRGRTQSEVVKKLNQIAAESGSRLVSRPERVTVEEWLRRYVQIRGTEVRPRTKENYRHYLTRIVPLLGGIHVQALRPMHVRTAFAKLAEGGLSPSVRQHLHHFLASALREAVRMELLERNPLDAVKPPRGGRVVLPCVWSGHEAATFLRTARDDRLYPLFYALLTLGLRIGEALALTWSDLDGERLTIRRTLSVVNNRPHFGPPKTQRGVRDIYLSPDVVHVFEERRVAAAMEQDTSGRESVGSGLVFSTAFGTPLSPNNVRRSFRRLARLAGVPEIRIHDLRHTYITLARDAGVDAEVVAKRVGQDVRVTMKVYSSVTEGRMRKAAKTLNDLCGVEL